MKMQRTIVIRRDYLHYIRKYNRFEKRHRNMSVHLSPCFRYFVLPVVNLDSNVTLWIFMLQHLYIIYMNELKYLTYFAVWGCNIVSVVTKLRVGNWFYLWLQTREHFKKILQFTNSEIATACLNKFTEPWTCQVLLRMSSRNDTGTKICWCFQLSTLPRPSKCSTHLYSNYTGCEHNLKVYHGA
jgi:hypothetical protein